MSDSQQIKRNVVNKYLGFKAVGEHSSAGIFVLLALIIGLSTISFIILLQDNVTKYNTFINVKNITIIASTLLFTYLLLIGNLIGRYSYKLINGGIALVWGIIFTVIYSALGIYLYDYEQKDKYSENFNKLMNVFLAIILFLGITLSVSPFSCQMTNIIFNYSNGVQSIQNVIISEVIRKIPNERLEELVSTIPSLFQNPQFN
jgi:hypothetical protein